MFSLFLKEVIKLHVDFSPFEIYTKSIKAEKTISRLWTFENGLF